MGNDNGTFLKTVFISNSELLLVCPGVRSLAEGSAEGQGLLPVGPRLGSLLLWCEGGGSTVAPGMTHPDCGRCPGAALLLRATDCPPWTPCPLLFRPHCCSRLRAPRGAVGADWAPSHCPVADPRVCFVPGHVEPGTGVSSFSMSEGSFQNPRRALAAPSSCGQTRSCSQASGARCSLAGPRRLRRCSRLSSPD